MQSLVPALVRGSAYPLIVSAFLAAPVAAQSGPIPDPARSAAYRTIPIEGAYYPKKAIRAGIQGDVGVDISVDPTGRLLHCVITSSSGSADLDKETCTLLRYRFFYYPAKDASGQPTKDRFNGVLMWRLAQSPADRKGKSKVRGEASFKIGSMHAADAADYPLDAAKAGKQGDVDLSIAVDASGHPGGCVILKSSGTKSLDDASCRMYVERVRFHPARDAAGAPMPGTYQTQVRWRIEDYALLKREKHPDTENQGGPKTN